VAGDEPLHAQAGDVGDQGDLDGVDRLQLDHAG
jgi:hypothetical protein